VKSKLAAAYDEKFTFLFTQLAVQGTRCRGRAVRARARAAPPDAGRGVPAVAAAPDDADLSD
jgi:hypothetical protein